MRQFFKAVILLTVFVFIGLTVCQDATAPASTNEQQQQQQFPEDKQQQQQQQNQQQQQQQQQSSPVQPPKIIESKQSADGSSNQQKTDFESENQESKSRSSSSLVNAAQKQQQQQSSSLASIGDRPASSPLDVTEKDIENSSSPLYANSTALTSGSSARTFDGWNDCVGADGGKYGTCKNDVECKKKKGIPDGTCMGGLGVCCVMALTCGEKTHENNTFFANADYPEPSWEARICSVEVKPKKSKTMQIMIEFEDFELAPPNANGECITDVFQIKLASGRLSPYSQLRICGQNTGQHMYLDVSQLEHDENLLLTVATSGGGFPRRWSIRIVHLDEKNYLLAPPGCLQYYTDTVGHFRSFNLGKNLRNLYYAICFRIDNGYSGIRFTDNFFGMNGPVCSKKSPPYGPKGPLRLPHLPPPPPPPARYHQGGGAYASKPTVQPYARVQHQPQKQIYTQQPQTHYQPQVSSYGVSSSVRYKRESDFDERPYKNFASDSSSSTSNSNSALTLPTPSAVMSTNENINNGNTDNKQQASSDATTKQAGVDASGKQQTSESSARTWSHEKEEKKEHKADKHGDYYPPPPPPPPPQHYGMPGQYGGSHYGGGQAGYGYGQVGGYGQEHGGYGHPPPPPPPHAGPPAYYPPHYYGEHHGKFDHKASKFDEHKYEKFDEKEAKKEDKKGWWPSWGAKKEEKKHKKEKYTEHHEAAFPFVRMFELPHCEPRFCGLNDVITFPPSGDSIAEMCGNTFNRGRGPKYISGSPLVVYVSNRGAQRGSGFDMNYEQIIYAARPY